METSAALERTILALLAKRRPGATICPSDAARAVSADGWQELMDDARTAAGRLVASGDVEITQHGEVVDLAAARGPIRIRRTGAGGRRDGALPGGGSGAGAGLLGRHKQGWRGELS